MCLCVCVSVCVCVCFRVSMVSHIYAYYTIHGTLLYYEVFMYFLLGKEGGRGREGRGGEGRGREGKGGAGDEVR